MHVEPRSRSKCAEGRIKKQNPRSGSERLPDGRPKTAELIGHNGGPPIDDPIMADTGAAADTYDFDLREQWG